jgi:hypothetical protein
MEDFYINAVFVDNTNSFSKSIKIGTIINV